MKISPPARRHGHAKRTETIPPLALNVFVGYADMAAFRRATAAIGEGVRTYGRKFQLHPFPWRFDQLGSTYWRDRALTAARDAHVVVLASSSPSSLTPAVEGWINAYLETADGRRTTLVVILSPADAWTISLEIPRRLEDGPMPLRHPESRQKLVA